MAELTKIAPLKQTERDFEDEIEMLKAVEEKTPRNSKQPLVTETSP